MIADKSDIHSLSADSARRLFGGVARRYDLLNRLISLGQDRRWRRLAVSRLAPRSGERVLDLGAGTGDLALETVRQFPGVRVIAADLTPEMVRLGRRRPGGQDVLWVIADAAALPFRAESFDGLVSGFLLRNLADLDPALVEQLRVLKPGGRWAALDTSRPPRNAATLIELHLRLVIPLLGGLVAGQSQAYRYLAASTRGFLTAKELARRLAGAGLRRVGSQRRMLGMVAIVWGAKRANCAGGTINPLDANPMLRHD
jgi:demethylmenaquinone methyltransferase/2-methoxy-6-polyprenyl-1,4-benzoquinol methylase